MELIRNEKIDMSIDCHEASIMYPVVSTYVAHDRSMDIAMMAAMDLSATTFDMKIEQSPKSLKGFTHREWGDYSDTLAVLMETTEATASRASSNGIGAAGTSSTNCSATTPPSSSRIASGKSSAFTTSAALRKVA